VRTGGGAASLTWIREQQAAAKGRIRKLLAGIASCCLEWRVPGDLACVAEANSGDEDSQEGGAFSGVLVRGVSTPTPLSIVPPPMKAMMRMTRTTTKTMPPLKEMMKPIPIPRR